MILDLFNNLWEVRMKYCRETPLCRRIVFVDRAGQVPFFPEAPLFRVSKHNGRPGSNSFICILITNKNFLKISQKWFDFDLFLQ